MTHFTVKKLEFEYTHGDVVLIPKKYRSGIKSAKCVKVVSPAASRIVQVYGKSGDTEPNIYMDMQTRNHFGLSLEAVAELRLVPVGWIGQILWAARNADLAVRMSAQLGVISVFLGVVGLGLGFLSVWLAVHGTHP